MTTYKVVSLVTRAPEDLIVTEEDAKMLAERVAASLESFHRCVAFAFARSVAIPPECDRCLGVHQFGETCVDTAMRNARERGLIK